MKNIEWKKVNLPGFDRYEVSNEGQIRLIGGRVSILSQRLDSNGYFRVTLYNPITKSYKVVHVAILVAGAFLGSRPKGHFVLHKNGNAKDNRLDNLRYGTQSDNMRDAINHGTFPRLETHNKAKITAKQAAEIYQSTETYAELAKRFNLAPSNITFIKNGKTWSEVTKYLDRGFSDHKKHRMNFS